MLFFIAILLVLGNASPSTQEMNILRVVLLGHCEIPFCGRMDDAFQVKFILFLIPQGIGFDDNGVILNVANVIQM